MRSPFRNILSIILFVAFFIGISGCASHNPIKWIEDTAHNKEIKNIILFIGDGMGRNQVKFGEYAFGKQLSFTNTDSFTLVNTYSIANEITDSAAASTAIATGILTKGGFVSVNHSNPEEEYETIIDFAKKYGKSTGIITTEYLTGATPMGFMGHGTRDDDDALTQTGSKSGVDLIAFDNSNESEYVDKYEAEGYAVVTDYKKIATSSGKIIAPLSIRPLEIEGEDLVTLKDVVVPALEKLSKNENGFFIIIEGAHIDHAGHSNDTDYLLRELQGFDEGVNAAIEWANKRDDTAIFVTADHETGGFIMEDFPDGDRYNAMVSDDGGYTYHPKYYRWTSDSHTGTHVGLWVIGVDIDFEDYSGIAVTKGDNTILKNTEINFIWRDMIIGHKFIVSKK